MCLSQLTVKLFGTGDFRFAEERVVSFCSFNLKTPVGEVLGVVAAVAATHENEREFWRIRRACPEESRAGTDAARLRANAAGMCGRNMLNGQPV